jgi:hypothetical protein
LDNIVLEFIAATLNNRQPLASISYLSYTNKRLLRSETELKERKNQFKEMQQRKNSLEDLQPKLHLIAALCV